MCKEIKEYLVICGCVYFIYDQDNRFFGLYAPLAEAVKNLCHPNAGICFISKRKQFLGNFWRHIFQEGDVAMRLPRVLVSYVKPFYIAN